MIHWTDSEPVELLPNYDAWKLASPPEPESDDELDHYEDPDDARDRMIDDEMWREEREDYE